ncbi:transglutaminase [Martelella alba]|uniref:Transglutaminase n=2 Tax=Martelella alba TaxID=2590451 RepID=A0A506UGX1_9HYPH|nr:transglutaminase-like cysteine peptidase [Martelella alba]TPW32649.1 transglutaminase [Martelella alba]
MPTGGITSQPIGHYEFCQLHRVECAIKSSNTAPADLTRHGWATIQKINLQVNETVAPVTDQELYGRDEVWAYPTHGAGDCEDYVLEKRRLLIKAGIPVTDLLITVVRKPNGEGHAVLTLRTTGGDYVLDNLNNAITLWYATPYTFLKRQASFDTGRWVRIENSTDLPVAALK